MRILSILFSSLLLTLLTACEKSSDSPATTVDSNGQSAVTVQSGLPEGIVLVEKFEGDESGISIPFAKYELANGLTVILHEDHSDPMVHVDVTYHVGSNREEPGRSGFAHFFEHMMFQGSENVGDEEHFKIVSNAGGTMNGSTNTDRTNYFQTVPANQLETVLWLEADRMGVFLDAVTQEKFETQRETVKNERGQRVDNQPYGRRFETIGKNLYPSDHPYSWPVIGWLEDLNRADLDDLKRFFLRWYGPNNAALTIGGAIDPMQTLAMVDKYFGSIPRGPEVEPLPKQPATLDSDRYVTLEDNVRLPMLIMSMPTVHGYHADEPAIDTAAKIMGQGQASLLYQRLVQTNRALQVQVAHPCRELACEMVFLVLQNPASGESLADMEQAVRETIDEFASRTVSEDDLQKFKAWYESATVFGLQSVSGKVSSLAQLELMKGTPAGKAEEIEKYLNVTADDVTRVFQEYINNKPALILSIVPNGQADLAAAPQNFDAPPRNIPESYGDEDGELPLRPVVDNFDRSIKPTPGPNPQVELPPVLDTTLANGVRLLAVPNTETPTVTIRAVFDAGQRDEPPGKAGLTALMTAMMGEATLERSASEFAEATERLGASIGARPGVYESTMTLSVLSKYLDEAMPLFMERLMKPAFRQEDFDRIKGQTIEALLQSRKTPQGLASRAIGVVMEGADNPLSYPVAGIPETVTNITLEDVKEFYNAHFPARLAGITASTSLPQEALVESLSDIAQIEVSEAFRPEIAERPALSGRTIYLVNKEGAAQSSIRTGQPALKYDALGDYYRAGLANFVLGGTFNSRINLNLREDKGYTYGARTSFSGGPELGSFRFSAEVNKDATAASITEVLMELNTYVDSGMDQDDYDYMRSAIGQRDALQYETPGRKLGLLNNILRYDLPLNYRTLQSNILKESDRESLNQLATELIDPENMVIVVVGDKATIQPELEALGMPIVELDETGQVIQ